MLAAARRRIPKRTRRSAKTSAATRCRIGRRQAETAGEDPAGRWRRLEADARHGGGGRASHRGRKRQQRQAEGRRSRANRRAAVGPARSKAQRNFTDPESRIMKVEDGFVQAYNAQAPSTQAPSHCSRTNSPSAATIRASCALVEAIENNLGRKPEQALSGTPATAANPISKRSSARSQRRRRLWSRPTRQAPDRSERKNRREPVEPNGCERRSTDGGFRNT